MTDEAKAIPIAVLCSGKLGFETLVKLVDLGYNIRSVMTDIGSESVATFCRQREIACLVGNPRSNGGNQFLANAEIDVILSANYLFLITEEMIDQARKLSFNLHGSLLPKYRGRTPHVWAIINGETEAGVTAHKIVQACDAGDILEQVRVPIEPEDTGANILSKYSDLYLPIIEKVLNGLVTGVLTERKQDHTKATSFGKRTPEDGVIDWNWQRSRIRNWVRAQSFPYPGAFTTYGSERIIIDRISYSDVGFEQAMPNGLILSAHPKIIVKTPNGAISIDSIRSKENFAPGNVFGKQ